MSLRTPLLATLILLLAISACGCVDRESVITGEEAVQAVAYADPIAENLLAGLNEDSYTSSATSARDETEPR